MKTNIYLILLTTVVSLAAASPVRAANADENSPASFHESFHFPLGDYWCEPNRLSAVDVDGDGRKDIVLMATALVTNNSVRTYNCRAVLLRAQPGGGFVDSVIADFPGDYGYNISTGDLNNDGSPDIVLRASQVTHVFLNDGQGNFRRVGGAPSGYYIGQLVDVNRDGYLDILSGTQTGAGGAVLEFDGDTWTGASPKLAEVLVDAMTWLPRHHRDIRELAEAALRHAGVWEGARVLSWQADVWPDELPPGAID